MKQEVLSYSEETDSPSVEKGEPNEEKPGNLQTYKSGMDDEDVADLARIEDVAHAFSGVGRADLAQFEAAKAAEI